MGAIIRGMTKDDTERVGEILHDAFTGVATKYGYAPVMQSVQEGKSWAWAMFHYGSSEGIVAEEDGRVVGVVFLNKRGEHGGAGPMGIDPHFQGTTIAAKLMDALMEKGKCLSSLRAVQEAFNIRSFSLMYAYNFLPVTEVLDLYLNGNSKQPPDQRHSTIYELTAKDIDEICEYDLPRSQFDRRVDIAYFVRWGKVLVYRDQRGIRGFLACLPSAGSVQLGPLLTEGEEEAGSLFRYAVAVFKGKTCRTRVMARDSTLAHSLLKMGFRLYCLNLLMIKGAWRPGKYIEAFGRFPEGV